MKRFSQLVSFLLAVVMVIGLLPGYVSAEEIDEPPAVTAGEEFTVTTGKTFTYFSFTPEADGLYTFESYSTEDTYGCIFDADGNLIGEDCYSGEGRNFAVAVPMTKGMTYTLAAMYNCSVTTGNYTASITQNDTVALTSNAEHTQDWGTTCFYTFTAEADGCYALYTNSSLAVYYNKSWTNWFPYYRCWGTRDAFVDLSAGQTVYLRVEAYGNPATVGVKPALAVESITYEDSLPVRCSYIPDSSDTFDVYPNITPAHADTRNLIWSFADSSLAEFWVNDTNYCKFQCNGVGETDLIASDGDTEMLRIPVVIEGPPDLTLNQPVTVTFTGSTYYNFTPEVSGTYSFAITETEHNVILESADGTGDSGFGSGYKKSYPLSVALEAGETFCLKLRGNNPTSCTIVVTLASSVTSITADVTQIQGVYVDVFRPSCFIDLTFEPADADISDLSVTVLDPSVAEVSQYLSKTEWRILPLSVGATELLITAGDAELRIPITFEAPTSLVSNTPLLVSTDARNEEFYFQFTAEESGHYNFYIYSGDKYNLIGADLYSESGWVTSIYGTDFDVNSNNTKTYAVDLEAGETYVLHADTGDFWAGNSFTVGVSKDISITSITSNTTALEFWYIPHNFNFTWVEVDVAPSTADVSALQWEILDTSVAALEGSDATTRKVYPTGGGETELVISAGNGVELRIPITVTAPAELTVDGTYYADMSDGAQWYAFTPEETGEYILYSDYEHTCAGAMLYYINADGHLDNIAYSNFGYDYGNAIFQLRNELEAGITYYYKIDYWAFFSDEPGTQFHLIEPYELIDITVNTDPISGYVGTGATALEIVTTPQYADMSGVTVVSTNSEIVTVSYKNGVWYYTLVGEGAAQIVVSYGDQVYTIDVESKLIPALELDVPVHTVSENYEDVRLFTFTPETDGEYTFYADVDIGDIVMYLTTSSGGELAKGRGGEHTAYEDIHAYLEAGNTYTLTVYCDYMYSVADYAVTVTRSLPLESISCADSQITLIWNPNQDAKFQYIYLDLYPAHAAVDYLTYTIMDTSVAAVGMEVSGYYVVYATGLGETELVISDGNGVELRIPVIVTDRLYGDVNNDGSVDNVDATLVLQKAAGWDVELANEAGADVNGDNSIDNVDATLILQKAAGWDVVLGPQN